MTHLLRDQIGQAVMSFESILFARDLAYGVAQGEVRKRENAAARARCQNNAALCASLRQEAQRRGLLDIDWAEYFRSIRIND